MPEIVVSLTEPLLDYATRRAESTGRSDVGEFMQDLVEEDRRRRREERIDELLLEGLRSEPIEVTEEFWASLHEGVRRRAAERAAGRRP